MNLLDAQPEEPRGPARIPGRECDDCALCCKLLPIPNFKPAGPWCQFCSTHKGCDNYENRPQPCRTYFCSFMVDKGLGEEWRPTKARMFLTVTEGDGTKPQIRVIVDPSRPDAWRKQPYFASFKQWSQNYYIIINIGERRVLIFPDHEKDLGVLAEGQTIEFVAGAPGSGIQLTAQVRTQH